jgi:hypothetical protein
MKRAICPAVLAILLAVPCRAATVVQTAAVTAGTLTFTNTFDGLTISGSLPGAAFMDRVNGQAIAPVSASSDDMAWGVEGVGEDAWRISQAMPPSVLVIGAGTGLALLGFTFDAAVVEIGGGPGNSMEVTGRILRLLANGEPDYDFGRFASGGLINFAFTATSYSGTSSLAGVFTTPFASATGVGVFSLVAPAAPPVPEPSSAVLGGLALLMVVIAPRITRDGPTSTRGGSMSP